MMRYRNGLVAVGLIGTVLAGSACGVPSSKAVKATGGSASAAAAATTTSVAPGTTSSDTGATSTTSGSDPTTTPAVSTGPLEGKLLTLADVPKGWTKGTDDSPDTSSDSGSDSSGSTDCSKADPTAGPLASLPDRAKVEFDKGVSGASSLTDLHLFQEQLARGTVAEVSAAYADLVSGVDRCAGHLFVDSGSRVLLTRKSGADLSRRERDLGVDHHRRPSRPTRTAIIDSAGPSRRTCSSPARATRCSCSSTAPTPTATRGLSAFAGKALAKL